MSRFYKSLCASLCALSITTSYADAPGGLEELMPDAMGELTAPALATPSFSETSSELKSTEPAAAHSKIAARPKVTEAPFSPFTGKVKARKVRMRLHPDLDSRIIKELNKNELLSIVGEKGDFWAVQPNEDFKAFVFRSFVLDNVVEGNRVNVRLEPHLDAPVIGHLNSGDKITDGIISAQNNKWLEITAPATARFYVAKDYIDYAGSPDVKIQFDKRRHAAEQLLDANTLLSKSELRKPFEEVDFDRIVKGYQSLIDDYSEFSETLEQAHEALASFQEAYLQKRIDYLESKAIADASADQKAAALKEHTAALTQITDKMRMWEPIEEALYLTWSHVNDQHNVDQFYEDQKLTATTITGILESYNSPVKSKPGDFIIRDQDLPVAYVYSTHINLQSLIGKKVTLNVTPRPNHNFAFPAYYVLDVE